MHKESESGQAIVLLVFAVVGLIGFTALAIDGGMVYSDRRHAQSASDGASLAGGGFIALALDNYHIFARDFHCSLSDVQTIMGQSITVATNRAISNDYINPEIDVSTLCEDNGTIYDEKYIDITTIITREVNTSLIHFVYDGQATNVVESTVRVRPRSPLALGNAIVALNEDPCSGNSNGIIAGGSSGTFIHGGGMWSNGCLKCNGAGPNFEVIVDPPDGISYAGTLLHCGSDELDPDPVQVPEPLPVETWDLEPPDCTGLPNRSMPSGKDVVLNPGIYNEINDNGKDTVILNPGLYCVTGSPKAVKISNGWFFGNGVTLYATNGSVHISGGGDDEGNPSILRAPGADPDPAPAIPGVLIYLAHGNTQDVQLTGNSETEFTGTVYVPDGDITVTGTGELGAPFSTQLIGLNVQVEGDAFIDINFDDNNLYTDPPYVDMLE
jgi:hypothetical protein